MKQTEYLAQFQHQEIRPCGGQSREDLISIGRAFETMDGTFLGYFGADDYVQPEFYDGRRPEPPPVGKIAVLPSGCFQRTA